MREALKKKLQLGKKIDAVLLRAIIAGEKRGEQITYEYEMVIKRDPNSITTAMAIATGSTVSVVAQMVGNGVITERGVFPPESVVPGDAFVEAMAERGVKIKETSHRSAIIVKW